ncbi:hypothetical protein NITMOv2_4712 [Nitrospira moscoviensis]|uniref:Uncharacterized protein n=1 Tax=Nitrospira moscoviensis TaxID=42253 RepID=A0A0K2GJG2_NITMO|nr:hypothetical protein NITMOv2_4712 [Nitrospira moscoviensis]
MVRKEEVSLNFVMPQEPVKIRNIKNVLQKLGTSLVQPVAFHRCQRLHALDGGRDEHWRRRQERPTIETLTHW